MKNVRVYARRQDAATGMVHACLWSDVTVTLCGKNARLFQPIDKPLLPAEVCNPCMAILEEHFA